MRIVAADYKNHEFLSQNLLTTLNKTYQPIFDFCPYSSFYPYSYNDNFYEKNAHGYYNSNGLDLVCYYHKNIFYVYLQLVQNNSDHGMRCC